MFSILFDAILPPQHTNSERSLLAHVQKHELRNDLPDLAHCDSKMTSTKMENTITDEEIEDQIDLEEARKALADIHENGGIPWEEIKASLGLDTCS